MKSDWLRPEAVSLLEKRDYSKGSLAKQLSGAGLEAGLLVKSREELAAHWIPGVELFHRPIYPQRHRGFFGEFAREGEGACGRIGLWPRQWATARMFAGTAKGFHIHPPSIPEGTTAEAWFERVFVAEPENFSLRRYTEEQWDMMFFVQGLCEFLLVDERAGLPRRIMHFWIDGDDQRGVNNVGLIIPPGVAHALRAEGSRDLIMVYGTSTTFNPDWEGRIASGVERADLPADWETYLASVPKPE